MLKSSPQCDKPSGQFIGLIMMIHWYAEVWIQIWGISVALRYYLSLCGESCLLVSWCVGDRCDITGSDEDLCRSRRPGAEDRGSQAHVGYLVAGRSWGQVTPCVICTVHMEMRSTCFLVEPQNQDRRVSQLRLKTGISSLVIWASKSPSWFFVLDIKIKRALVCRLYHKTDGGRLTWDTCRDLAACFGVKQVGLEFPTPASRLVNARWWVVHVTSSPRLCRDEAEDGRVDAMNYVGSFYHKITVFYVLGHRGNLVFSVLLDL
jgi:hypothetical protein